MDRSDKFLEMEETHHLFDRKVKECHYWTYLRYHLYYPPQTYVSGSKTSYTIKEKLQRWYYMLTRSMPQKTCDFLFLRSPRYSPVEGEEWSVVTDPVIRHFHKSGYKSYVYEHYEPNFRKDIIKARKEMYVDIWVKEISRTLFFSKIYTHKLKKIIKKEVEFLAKLFKECIGEDVNTTFLERELLLHYIHSKVGSKFYKNLLKKSKPKVIFSDSCAHPLKMILIAEAKKQNIPTVELQHGRTGTEHITHNYKGKRYVPRYPDYFFAFSDYWKEATRFPIEDSHVCSVGYPYLEHFLKKFDKTKPRENKILFLTQGLEQNNKELLIQEFILSFYEYIVTHNIPYKIMVKFHPSEITKGDVYDRLFALKDHIEFVDNKKRNIYQCFSEATAQVSFRSSSLYEGLAFDLDTFVYDIEGSQVYQDLIDKEYAFLFRTPDELGRLLMDPNKKKQNVGDYFWKGNALENIQKETENILRSRNNPDKNRH